jgi:hypothetical protein
MCAGFISVGVGVDRGFAFLAVFAFRFFACGRLGQRLPMLFNGCGSRGCSKGEP